MKALSEQLQQSGAFKQLHNKYQALNERDRKALLLMIGFLTCVLFYVMVWKPLAQWANDSQSGYFREQETLAWLEVNAPIAKQVQASQSRGQQFSKDKISAVVTSAARRSGIKLSRVQPGSQGVTVWAEKVPYQKLLEWLVYLRNQYQLSVDKIRIDAQDEPGVVRVYVSVTA
ncbi:type II secretion system protein M [Endozoicomonas sp. SM1973]|uniref:Type II secretion system protein M n=1 Tax=Spartinivicinus marinus TaxID=2994442 RepID=A0A853IC44_9GAMM|nr:type II secretion system protein M [Spartinivicinus marinus]MCX4024952.1 type II secretion system protein M [Spartinivicinus marinus]NYZ67644.1 type II secretion system protein M [Spartinivicinus marinus]